MRPLPLRLRNMLFELLLISAARLVAAQSSTTSLIASPVSQTPPPPHPTASIFFPGSLHGKFGDLGASVISANVNQTEYAVGCLATQPPIPSNNASTSQQPRGCDPAATSLTVTAGESTLVYTFLPEQSESNIMPGTSLAPAPTSSPANADADADATTIACLLLGGPTATQAVCTARSSIDGLGDLGSTTTLASSQIDYAVLTITAGGAKMTEVAGGAGGLASEVSAAGAGVMTARAGWRGGVGAAVVVGMLL